MFAHKFHLCLIAAVIAASQPLTASASGSEGNEVIRVSTKEGKIRGQVFANLHDQKTPLAGKVTLTDAEGTVVSALRTDEDGNFLICDIEPGKYKAIGVVGDFVGDADIEVTVHATDDEADTGYYTVIPLAVGPVSGESVFASYSNLSANALSHHPVGNGDGTTIVQKGFGVSGGTPGGLGGPLGPRIGMRRLLLLGAAISLPLALQQASPDE